MCTALPNAQLLNPGRNAGRPLSELNALLYARRCRLAGGKSSPTLLQDDTDLVRPGSAQTRGLRDDCSASLATLRPASATQRPRSASQSALTAHGRPASASASVARPISAQWHKKKRTPQPLTSDDVPPKPAAAWNEAAKSDPIAREVCAQLDECALVGWKATLDLKEKRDFFRELHNDTERDARRFEGRAADAVRIMDAAEKELATVHAARLAAQEQHKIALADLQRQLDGVNARNAMAVEKRFREQANGRHRRRAGAAQAQTWQNEMLAVSLQKTRAKKQMEKNRLATAEAVALTAEKKEFIEVAKKENASEAARLRSLEEELAALTKANILAGVKAKQDALTVESNAKEDC